jgi:hypothetical protein
VVSIDRLADELYGEAPPVSAVTQIHRQISELRALLEPDRAPGAAGAVIETRPPGYRILVTPDELDLTIFERVAKRLVRTTTCWPRTPSALRTARCAARPWCPGRSRALRVVRPPRIERLNELRLAVTERCLTRSSNSAAPSSCPDSSGSWEHPLNERLRGRLMVALYRAGRQPEALRCPARRAPPGGGVRPGAHARAQGARGSCARQDPASTDRAPRGLRRPGGSPHRAARGAGRSGLIGSLPSGGALAALGRHEAAHAGGRGRAVASAPSPRRARRDELATGGSQRARRRSFHARSSGT